MMQRLLCLFLCVGVSVEELERNLIQVTSPNQNRRVVSFPPQHDRKSLVIPKGPPKVQVTKSNVQGRIGSNSTFLECFMDSNPRSTNFWTRGSDRIYENNTNYKVYAVQIAPFRFRYRLRLQILYLEKQDYSRIFRCSSHNKLGDDYGEISIETVPPLITTFNNTIEAHQGSNVVLECSVVSFPRANTYWFNSKGNQIMESDRFALYSEETVSSYQYKVQLHITNLKMKDFTSYECRAANRLGSHHQIIELLRAPSLPKPKPKPNHVCRPVNDGLLKYFILVILLFNTIIIS